MTTAELERTTTSAQRQTPTSTTWCAKSGANIWKCLACDSRLRKRSAHGRSVTGQKTHRECPAGPTLTAKRMGLGRQESSRGLDVGRGFLGLGTGLGSAMIAD